MSEEQLHENSKESDLESDEVHTEHLSKSLLLMMLLIVVNIVALSIRRKLAEKSFFVQRLIQDATVTTTIGLIVGGGLSLLGQDGILKIIGQGYEDLFMLVLLPMIIFESTINMNKESFFKNIGSILMYAVFGTLIATVMTSFGLYYMGFFQAHRTFTLLESFIFGSLISATDPVSVLAIFKEMNADQLLYSLIFGESMLNDAISITSYNTFVKINDPKNVISIYQPVVGFLVMMVGSLLTGFAIAIVTAIILKYYFRKEEKKHSKDPKHKDHQEHNRGIETIIMIIVPWLAYLIGESLESLSGIVTIVFCGIALNKYALPNMNKHALKLTQNMCGILSHTFENLVFMFIGIGVFSFQHDWVDLGIFFFVGTCLLITVSRFVQIYFISWVLNVFRQKNKIGDNFKAVMSHSGFRGSMAFALAISAAKTESLKVNKVGKAMLSLSLVYIAVTTYIVGTILVPLLEYYKVQAKPEEEGGSAEHEEQQGEIDLNASLAWNKFKTVFVRIDDGVTGYLAPSKMAESVRHGDYMVMSAYGQSNIK